mmetsp:Transcript_5310/g.12921  ORF Transcript_5310/g.12921 Transcript_5310/m.12921 type:complete len:118 (-) Transcript_5310:292-645(-)
MPRTGKLKKKTKGSIEVNIDEDCDFIPRENPATSFHTEGFQFTVIDPKWVKPIRAARTVNKDRIADNEKTILFKLRTHQLEQQPRTFCPMWSTCKPWSVLRYLCCCWSRMLKALPRL